MRYAMATAGLLVALAGAGQGLAAQAGTAPVIPLDATVLEGTPRAKVEASEEGVQRRALTLAEAEAERLAVSVVDGRYYWKSRDGRPLTLSTAGDMTYLTSTTQPGRYIRLRRVNDRLTYVEHLDMGSRSITYWGVLRVVLKK